MTINEGIDAVSKEVCCSNTVHILLHDFVEKFLNFKTFFCMLSDLISEDRQKILTMVDLTFWHVSTWKRQEWIHLHNIYAPRKKDTTPSSGKIRFIPRIFFNHPLWKLQDLSLMTNNIIPRMDSPLSSWWHILVDQHQEGSCSQVGQGLAGYTIV